MKFLYKSTKNDSAEMNIDEMDIGVFSPGITRLILNGEKRTFKLLLVRFLFWISTRGRVKIYYATQNGELVHTSCVIPKCYKFPFLDNEDYEIGPCVTYPKFRGKGVYPWMLKHICSSIGDEKTVFYMIVDETNISSIKGIEKAGFVKCGTVRVSKFIKQYQLERVFVSVE